jgi:hypothetical protein
LGVRGAETVYVLESFYEAPQKVAEAVQSLIASTRSCQRSCWAAELYEMDRIDFAERSRPGPQYRKD